MAAGDRWGRTDRGLLRTAASAARCPRPAVVLVALCVGGAGACDDGRAPGAGGGSVTPRRDGGVPAPSADAAVNEPGRGDGGPVLPGADLEVTLPFGDPQIRVELAVEAALGELDVHFLVDGTGSIGGEIRRLQAALLDQIVPEVRARVPSTSFGVSRFTDFPAAPFGAPTDVPYELRTPVTSQLYRVERAVASLDAPLGNGGDVPEASAEALYQVATGEGYSGGGARIDAFDGPAAPGGGRVGGAGFRPRALRAVLHVTDAPTHEPAAYGSVFPGTRSLAEAIDALVEREIRVLGISSHPGSRPMLDQVALATGAVVPPTDGTCPTGRDGIRRAPVEGVCPLVFDVDEEGNGLDTAIVDALVGLVSTLAFDDVYGEVEDDRLGFVKRVLALRAEAAPGIPAPSLADRDGDGAFDTFVGVRAGTRLVFGFDLANDAIRNADYEQVFRLRVRVRSDALELVERVVRVRIPLSTREGP